MNETDLFRLTSILEAQRWIFAKTMPHVPHWYTLRRAWASDADFVWAVEMIRKWGYDDVYFRKTYRAINLNGYKYWTMGSPINETILINRKPLPEGDLGNV